ncbi:RNA polymerase sigma factor [Methylomonas sp. HW2-6]|uniref:RNA polymerase sigma factor n=1 Tax=Methylomonas sp. HW2-6 TaxID=3376687 RepID=UPI004042A597
MSTILDISDLIKTYDDELRRVMFRRCGCLDTAGDIVQETYQRMLAGDLWRQAENPRALLHRIAANLATDYERRRQVREQYAHYEDGAEADSGLDSTADPEQINAARERLHRLISAVERLPPKCRTVFVMRKYDGLSHAEIAERLGISRNMVEKHLRNALAALQDCDD